jgi:hypothetical protein
MTVPATVSPIAAGVDPRFMRTRAPDLARDIVAQIDTASSLAIAYGLTLEQWAILRELPAFKELCVKAAEDITSDAGIAALAARKAAMVIDRFGISDMAAVMGDPKAGAQHRVRAFEALAEVGKLTSKTGGSGSSAGAIGAGVAGPLIQINFPDGRQFSITTPPPDRTVIEHDGGGE